MLHKVTEDGTDGTPKQVECTLKQVEFEQMVVSPVKGNSSDSPVVEEESDEEEISTQEP